MSDVYPICPYCGSLKVTLDAIAEWHPDEQDWVLANTYEEGFCLDCEETIKMDFTWLKLNE